MMGDNDGAGAMGDNNDDDDDGNNAMGNSATGYGYED